MEAEAVGAESAEVEGEHLLGRLSCRLLLLEAHGFAGPRLCREGSRARP
jgi:hypothetical protein